MKYKNIFYSKAFDSSKEVIETDVKPTEYKGYSIYERIKGQVFDIVKDGVCIGMNAGLRAAKERIDKGIICAECGVLEDSYENEYPELCVPCGSCKAFEDWEGVIESELKVYNQRTNQDVDLNGFCFDGDAGQLNPDNLTGLPELYKIYESCLSNIEEGKQTGVPPEGDQLEIWFPTGDLPF